jgi:hypothetical protein
MQEELHQLDELTAARNFRAVLKLGAPLLMMPRNASDPALVRFYLGVQHPPAPWGKPARAGNGHDPDAA